MNLCWNDIVLIYCLISEMILHLYVWYLLIVNDAAYGVYVLICVRHPHVSIHVICVRHPQCSHISLHLLQRFSDSAIASGAAACIFTSAAWPHTMMRTCGIAANIDASIRFIVVYCRCCVAVDFISRHVWKRARQCRSYLPGLHIAWTW